MSILTIAWKSLCQRGLASSLTALSVALGVALMVTVLVIHGTVTRMFNTSAVGYHLVVGAKGSPMQLVLNSIYFMDRPIDNLPYKYYQQLKRNKMIESAIPFALGDTTADGRFRIVGTIPDYFETEYVPGKLPEFSEGKALREPFDAVLGARAARANGWRVGSEFPIAHGGNLNDVHAEKFKTVGVLKPTGTPIDRAVFIHLDGFYLIPGHEKPLEEAIERDKAYANPDAVSLSSSGKGSGKSKPKPAANKNDGDGARTEPASPGSASSGSGEAGEQEAAAPGSAGNATESAVPGTSKPEAKTSPSGTRGGDSKPDGEPETASAGSAAPAYKLIPDEQKEVTAVLIVAKSDSLAVLLKSSINEKPIAQAAHPIAEIAKLLRNLVGNVRDALVVMTVLIIAVSGVSIFVSIYNSMTERKREIAIMRALGASRSTVFSVVIVEAILLCLGGGILGMGLGHLLVVIAGPIVEARSDVLINPWSFEKMELWVIPALVLMAAIVGFVPAWTAYRTDVTRGLAE